MSRSSFSFEDPLEKFLRAPKGETAQERTARLAQEQVAARTSAEIDESLRSELQAIKKRRHNEVKTLLLGVSIPRPKPNLLTHFRFFQVKNRTQLRMQMVLSIHR